MHLSGFSRFQFLAFFSFRQLVLSITSLSALHHPRTKNRPGNNTKITSWFCFEKRRGLVSAQALTHFAVTSFRTGLMSARATMRVPILAWMAILMSWRGTSFCSFSSMRRAIDVDLLVCATTDISSTFFELK